MNFAIWVFNRIKKSVFGKEYRWISDYRELILQDKFMSIILTLGCGTLYSLGVIVVGIAFIDQAQTLRNFILFVIGTVPMFYVYNWIMALHEVYEKEKQKTWEALKQ